MTPANPAPSAADNNAPTPRTMEQIAQECAEKVCHEGCLLDQGVACELIATAIAQAVEQKDCKIANQAERIRYLEGATNHATGTPLSKATAECDQLQAALAAKDREIAELTDQLRIVVDAESFRARKIERERDQLRAALAAAQEDRDEHCARAASLVFKLGDVTCAEVRQWRDEYKANLAAMQKTLDWAESLLCNAKPMPHCAQDEWDEIVRRWRDQKHNAAIDQARKAGG